MLYNINIAQVLFLILKNTLQQIPLCAFIEIEIVKRSVEIVAVFVPHPLPLTRCFSSEFVLFSPAH